MKNLYAVAFLTLAAIAMMTGDVFGQSRFNSSKRIRANKPAIETAGPVSAAKPLLIEDFNLSTGAALTASGWFPHSAAGTNAQTVSAPGLTLTGYPGSGIGNAVQLATSGEDTNRTFASQTSGSVYAAFLVNLADASTDATGGYFIHLGPDPISTFFRGRVYARKDGSNNVSFGITKAGAVLPTDIAFTGFTFALNTTYLFVIKYTIVDGLTNDTVQLFISTNVPGTEPAATVTAPDTGGGDISPGSIGLRQGSATTAPTPRVDGIRVGTTWESVTGPFVSKARLDMDGDNRTDYVVLRDSNGATAGGFVDWYIQTNANAVFSQVQWGIYDTTTEEPAPADYDGDGKTDIAVYRRSALSHFYIIMSSNNVLWTDQLGLIDDDPVSGDYNGDGIADVAVRRQNNNDNTSEWFFRPDLFSDYQTLLLSSSGTRAGGDYNGDGFYDPAAFGGNGLGVGQFTILLSGGGGTTTVDFGDPTDFVAPGDYDGDGKTDECTISKVGGFLEWHFKRSIDGAEVVDTWGLDTDLPTPGDYNGDGKWDYAVWREGALSEFFIMTPVTRKIYTRQWGLTGDFPAATAVGVSNGI